VKWYEESKIESRLKTHWKCVYYGYYFLLMNLNNVAQSWLKYIYLSISNDDSENYTAKFVYDNGIFRILKSVSAFVLGVFFTVVW